MANRSMASVFLIGTLFLQAGCVMLESAQEMTRQSMRIFKPRPTDYRDLTEEEGDEWSYVGKLARGNQPREKDTDWWWTKFVMSEKARAIERNLGVD